jgi:hypothetical protein
MRIAETEMLMKMQKNPEPSSERMFFSQNHIEIPKLSIGPWDFRARDRPVFSNQRPSVRTDTDLLMYTVRQSFDGFPLCHASSCFRPGPDSL